jgi:uncharacterized protein YuzE
MIDRITVRSSNPPSIEFDHNVRAWYIRFKKAKVAKTVHKDRSNIVLAVDLDSNNEVVGVELLGVREFSINLFKKITNIDAPKIDFNRARFVAASCRELCGA